MVGGAATIQPQDLLSLDWKTVAVSACSILSVLAMYVLNGLRSDMKKQAVELREQAQKLATIDKSCITRIEFDREIEKLGEKIDAHREEFLDSIRDIGRKIEIHEARNDQIRNHTRSLVEKAVTQLAVMQDRLERKGESSG